MKCDEKFILVEIVIDGLIGRTCPITGLCLYIGLVVSLATNTVKVMSYEVGLRLLCCGMCFTYIHLFVTNHHNVKTFPKGFVE